MPEMQHAGNRGQATGHPALTDPETGLANGLHFDLVYSYLFAGGDRGLSFSVMLITPAPNGGVSDVDRLVEIGRRIRTTTRDSDLVAHMGNGRFVVLLLGTNLQGARIAADRIEMALGEAGTEHPCIGLAAYDNEMKGASELLEAADKALAEAEAAGGGVEFG